MKFRDVFNDLQSGWRESSVARRTARGLRHYRNSGEVLYPRLLGYRRTAVGIEIVESEAQIIRLILGMLADGKTIEQIKWHLYQSNLRNRSGNLFSVKEIVEMPKSVYGGAIETQSGKWVASEHYKPILSPQIVKNARNAISRLTSGRVSPSQAPKKGFS